MTEFVMSDVITFVLERAEESNLDAIREAMTSRRRILMEKAAANVHQGVRVRTRNLRPGYLCDLTGTVKNIETVRKKRCVVLTLDAGSVTKLALSSNSYAYLMDKDSYDLAGIPVTCCVVTDS